MTEITADSSFVGIDTSRDLIEAFVRPTGEVWTAPAGEEGIAELSEKLLSVHPKLVLMQATGGFELTFAGVLAILGLPFALVQPRNIREFAKAIGRSVSSSEGQAGLLAHFAELVRPQAWDLSEEFVEHLRSIRARRQDIVQMIALERGRYEPQSASSVVQKDIQQHIQFLERSLSNIEEQLTRSIRQSRFWR